MSSSFWGRWGRGDSTQSEKDGLVILGGVPGGNHNSHEKPSTSGKSSGLMSGGDNEYGESTMDKYTRWGMKGFMTLGVIGVVALLSILVAYAANNGTFNNDKVAHQTELDATSATAALGLQSATLARSENLMQDETLRDVKSSIRDSTFDKEKNFLLFMGTDVMFGTSFSPGTPNLGVTIPDNINQLVAGYYWGEPQSNADALFYKGQIRPAVEPLLDCFIVAGERTPRAFQVPFAKAFNDRYPHRELIIATEAFPSNRGLGSVLNSGFGGLGTSVNGTRLNLAISRLNAAMSLPEYVGKSNVEVVIISQGDADIGADSVAYATGLKATINKIKAEFPGVSVLLFGMNQNAARVMPTVAAIDEIQRSIGDTNSTNFIPGVAYIETSLDTAEKTVILEGWPYRKYAFTHSSIDTIAREYMVPAVAHAKSNRLNIAPNPAIEPRSFSLSTRSTGIRVMFHQPTDGGMALKWEINVYKADGTLVGTSLLFRENHKFQYYHKDMNINDAGVFTSGFEFELDTTYKVTVVAINDVGRSSVFSHTFIYSLTTITLTQDATLGTITAAWEFSQPWTFGSVLEFCQGSSDCTNWVPIVLPQGVRKYTLNNVKSLAAYQWRVAPRQVVSSVSGALSPVFPITTGLNTLQRPTSRWTAGIGTIDLAGVPRYSEAQVAIWKDTAGTFDFEQLSLTNRYMFARPSLNLTSDADPTELTKGTVNRPVLEFYQTTDFMCAKNKTHLGLHPLNGARNYTKVMILKYYSANHIYQGFLLSGYGTSLRRWIGYSNAIVSSTHKVNGVEADSTIGAKTCRSLEFDKHIILIATSQTNDPASPYAESTTTMWNDVWVNGLRMTGSATTATTAGSVTPKPVAVGVTTGDLCLGSENAIPNISNEDLYMSSVNSMQVSEVEIYDYKMSPEQIAERVTRARLQTGYSFTPMTACT